MKPLLILLSPLLLSWHPILSHRPSNDKLASKPHQEKFEKPTEAYHNSLLIKHQAPMRVDKTSHKMLKKAITMRRPDDPRKHLWKFIWPEERKKLQLIVRKIKMSEVFSPDGIRVPVTLLELLPETIIHFSPFGYAEVSYGGLLTEHAWLKRPHIGKLISNCGNHRELEPCIIQPPQNFLIGQILDSLNLLNTFHITITGVGKGKGFGGTVSRHGFHRGPESHGSRHHRRPGSIGAGTDPGRVFPGKKMPGRYGNKRTTIKRIRLIAINPIKNFLMVKGSVPGNPKSKLKLTY